MKKIVVTGATGLIGKEAIEPLKQAGFEVYTLNTQTCNIFDETAVKNLFEKIKPQYLLHFAWAASGDYLTTNANFDFLTASLNMLKHFKENGGARAVISGTCFEYEFKNELLKETGNINPQTVYAKCKNYLREIAQLYCAQNNISFGWGRIFYVLGHGEAPKRLTPYVINSLKNNQKVIIKSGNLVKDYMYTKDIAGAFVKFLESPVEGVVNICTGKPISLKDYALKIAQKLGKTDLVEIKNETTLEPPFIVGDNSRLINEVGYKIKYSLSEALDNIIK
jgi:nucleoside-diphosphate-sugar epimerase